MTTPYLAERIRAVARGDLHISELHKIAVQVERCELALDAIFVDAREADARCRTVDALAKLAEVRTP
jgi:hypothetical protein